MKKKNVDRAKRDKTNTPLLNAEAARKRLRALVKRNHPETVGKPDLVRRSLLALSNNHTSKSADVR